MASPSKKIAQATGGTSRVEVRKPAKLCSPKTVAAGVPGATELQRTAMRRPSSRDAFQIFRGQFLIASNEDGAMVCGSTSTGCVFVFVG